MTKFFSGLFGGGQKVDTSAISRDNAKLREQQEAEKRTLAEEKASRRRRRLSSRGALQFAETGAVGVSKTLGA